LGWRASKCRDDWDVLDCTLMMVWRLWWRTNAGCREVDRRSDDDPVSTTSGVFNSAEPQ